MLFRPAAGAVLANTSPYSEPSGPLMSVLLPSMFQSSPSLTAAVRIARAGSLPPDASVVSKKPFRSPRSVG